MPADAISNYQSHAQAGGRAQLWAAANRSLLQLPNGLSCRNGLAGLSADAVLCPGPSGPHGTSLTTPLCTSAFPRESTLRPLGNGPFKKAWDHFKKGPLGSQDAHPFLTPTFSFVEGQRSSPATILPPLEQPAFRSTGRGETLTPLLSSCVI